MVYDKGERPQGQIHLAEWLSVAAYSDSKGFVAGHAVRFDLAAILANKRPHPKNRF
jgi:hypothetical protein